MRTREVQHAHRSRRKCRLQLARLCADLHHARTSLAGGLVVAVALRAVDDHFGRRSVRVRQSGHRGATSVGDACGDGDGHARGSPGRDVAGFIAGQLRDALAHTLLQFHEIDERAGTRPHRVEHRGWHARAAKASQGRGGIDHWTDPQVRIAMQRGHPSSRKRDLGSVPSWPAIHASSQSWSSDCLPQNFSGCSSATNR